MSTLSGKRRFARIDRLPPYVFNITAELKLAARRRGEAAIGYRTGDGEDDAGNAVEHVVRVDDELQGGIPIEHDHVLVRVVGYGGAP